jgi:hypothetical protein
VENGVEVTLPVASTTSWRAWLTSGVRRVPIDRRRAQGADAHLKSVLVGGPSGTVDFSSAMARQAIDEGMAGLPPEHKEVVKLAYFGGLTNREIADHLGMPVGGVRRRLRQSLAILSTYIERGRTMGRRAVHGLVLWLTWRRFGDRTHGPGLDQVLQAGVVAVMTVVAASLVVAHHPAPGHVAPLSKPAHVSTAGSTGSNARQVPSKTVVAPIGTVSRSTSIIGSAAPVHAIPSLPVSVQALAQLPVSLPARVVRSLTPALLRRPLPALVRHLPALRLPPKVLPVVL